MTFAKSIFEKLFAFLPLLFLMASPARIVDDGGGAGDDGGAGGGGGDEGGGEGGGEGGDQGDDGAGGGDEGGEGEDHEGEDGGDGADEVDQDGEGGEDGEGGAGKAEKKPIDVHQALNKLRKSDPKLAAVLRKEHFENIDYRKVGTPAEVMSMRETFNLYGGEEGIQEIKQSSDDFAAELDMINRGDATILEDAFRDSPEGIMKLIPLGLEKMRVLDPKRYDRAIARPLSQIFRDKGVTMALSNARTLVQAAKQQEAFDMLGKLMDWIEGVDELAGQAGEEPLTDREKGLNKRDQEVQTKEQRIYQREVGVASIRSTNAIISKHLSPLLTDFKKRTGRPLTEDQKRDVAQGIYDEIGRNLAAKPGYKRQMDAYYARKASPEEIARYTDAQVNQFVAAVTKSVWGRKGWASAGKSGGKKPSAGGGSGGGSGKGNVVMMSRQPSPEQIDWSKDRDRSRFMGDGKTGEATMLGTGKVVRWRW